MAVNVDLAGLTPAQAGDLDRLLSDATVFARTYWADPAGFVRECMTWPADGGPAPYQLDILESLARHRRVAVRGPHGLGKSALASWVILWQALTRDPLTDWKVPITASAWRQLSAFLMPELRKWARRVRWDRVGRRPFTRDELLQLNLRLAHGEAFAMASNNPELMEGAHASSICLVIDESKAVPDETFDALEGALSTGDAYVFSISTPGEPTGRFYDIHRRRTGYEDWHVRHVTLREAIAAGRIGEAWAEQRRRQWGERSAVYLNRVMGEFASSAADGVIPLAWLELANQRWLDWREARDAAELDGTAPVLRLDTLGVDVARGGEDQSAAALRAGNVITELRMLGATPDTMELVGIVQGIQRAQGGRAVVDVGGVGGGPYDRLREVRSDCEPFNGAEGSTMLDRSGELGFVNRRAEAYWTLRELLDPANGEDIAIPPDDLLTGDLTAPRWRVVSGGKILIESKDDLRKAERLGRSPDAGDAVIMAFATRRAGNIRFMSDLPLATAPEPDEERKTWRI